MSRTLYSRPAEDVSTTHMEELMVNVGQITLSCVRVSDVDRVSDVVLEHIGRDFCVYGFDRS